MQTSLGHGESANATQTRPRLQFPVLDQCLSFIQKGSFESNLGTGSVVWDAGKVLAKYIERQRIFAKPLGRFIRCIELGSGCGISGISVIHLLKESESHPAFQFILTDIEKMLPLLEENLRSNPPAFPHEINPESIDTKIANLQVLPLQW